MRRVWTVLLLRNEQSSDDVWARVEDVGADWARTPGRRADGFGGYRWQLTVDAPDDLAVLLDRLAQAGANHRLITREDLEDDDYAAADFVGIWGADLGTDSGLVLNEATAYRSSPPCPRCGASWEFDQEAVEPLVVDETVLSHPAADGSVPGVAGWDLVDLANGQLLASRRLIDLLAVGEVRGYHLTEVVDASTGRPSTRYAALVSDTAVLTPCAEHAFVDGQPFCLACGTAYGTLRGPFWVRSDEIGEAEVFSRHPGRVAQLYLSGRAYRLLERAGLSGLRRTDIAPVCEHGPRAASTSAG